MTCEKKTRKRFWMCYVDGEELPKVQHWSKMAVKNETERLARLTGKDVFVLEAKHYARPAQPTPPVIWNETFIDTTNL